jgi:hypothetical protein
MAAHDKALRNEEYFEQYRSKKASLAAMKDQLTDLECAVSDKKNQIANLKTELESMRKIITAMIEQGVDPTEVRLRGTEELSDDIWETSETEMIAALNKAYSNNTLLTINPNWSTFKI